VRGARRSLSWHADVEQARTTWERLEPQLAQLARAAEEKGRDAVGAVSQLVTDVGQAVRKLRDELFASPHEF
jgi:hypothetical protein